MSDNPVRRMKNDVLRVKDPCLLERQINHLSVQTKLEAVSSNLRHYVQKQVQQSLLSKIKGKVVAVLN
jgi:hypothetical protein